MSKSQIDLCLPSECASCPAPVRAFNKKPGGLLDSAFSIISVANYTLGRAETRVDKGALVAGHASRRRRAGGRRRKQCGRTRTETEGERADMRII